MTRQITTPYHFVRAFLAAIVIILAFLAITIFSSGPRDISQLENIDGVAFPVPPPATIITEKLAHADIYINQSVLAKQLTLTITFTPFDTQELAVGIRENSFWLSYPKHTIYSGPGTQDTITKTITIPLTDKLADKDGSVDLMFFTTNQDSQPTEDEGIDDTTQWQLHGIEAAVSPVIPTKPQFKDYLRSIIKREAIL